MSNNISNFAYVSPRLWNQIPSGTPCIWSEYEAVTVQIKSKADYDALPDWVKEEHSFKELKGDEFTISGPERDAHSVRGIIVQREHEDGRLNWLTKKPEVTTFIQFPDGTEEQIDGSWDGCAQQVWYGNDPYDHENWPPNWPILEIPEDVMDEHDLY